MNKGTENKYFHTCSRCLYSLLIPILCRIPWHTQIDKRRRLSYNGIHPSPLCSAKSIITLSAYRPLVEIMFLTSLDLLYHSVDR